MFGQGQGWFRWSQNISALFHIFKEWNFKLCSGCWVSGGDLFGRVSQKWLLCQLLRLSNGPHILLLCRCIGVTVELYHTVKCLMLCPDMKLLVGFLFVLFWKTAMFVLLWFTGFPFLAVHLEDEQVLL